MSKSSGKKALVWLLSLCLIFSTTVGIVSAASVSDIKGHWAEDTIKVWVDQAFIVGYSDDTFRPDDPISREEITTLVNRSFGYTETGTIQFSDVVDTDWSYSDIAIGKQAGFIEGYPNGTFEPKKEMSRQEVAVIVSSLLELNVSSQSALSYEDGGSIAAWSMGEISAVKDASIMMGYLDGTFRALDSITRAEAVVVLDRAFKYKAALAMVPAQPILSSATVVAASTVTISAPVTGVTAWLAPEGTQVFAVSENMTNLTGDNSANTITAPITVGDYKLFLVNEAGTSLASEGTLTVSTIKVGPDPVIMGTADNYVILAKTGISSVPASIITGDIGVSPIDSTGITGFSLTMDATNVFSTSTQLIGKAYASDYTAPTSSNLTTAVSDMETAYTDAAGRAADYTELHAGDISDQTLVAGVYKWGTEVLINSDVTLHGGPDDVWIFQVASGITQANNTKIILTGGAQAKNIFWQAAGTVAIGTDAHFEGIVLGSTNITLGTNSSVVGRLLAQTAVALDQSTVVSP